MNTKETILNYWKSWQSHSDWDETRKFMSDDFIFDAGAFRTESADELIELMKKGNPWKEITLMDIVVNEDKGALVYEGVDSVTNRKIRIAEIMTVESGKVTSCISSIAEIPER